MLPRPQEPNSLCSANRKYPWELPVVPVGDTGTIPFLSRFPCAGAYGDRTKGGGDGCPLWYVNSWAMGWSRDI